jgi:Zn-dependent peptidase ImmA (M78 family)
MGILKQHSPEEIEAIASVFLEQLGVLDGNVLRVEHCISAKGYLITSVKGLRDIAEAYISVMGKRVYVDEDQFDNSLSFRYRFTLAEELSHILLHCPAFEGKTVSEIELLRDSISDAEYIDIERDAKRLAAALLMRKVKFLERFKHHFDSRSGISNELYKLKYVFRQLSMDFNVSCFATVLRAYELGLIDQPQKTELLEIF